MEDSHWRRCSVCKREVGYAAKYYVCSVSTCNGPRTNYVFCGVPCFERHLPGARHRDAGAIEKTAPTLAQAKSSASAPPPPPTVTEAGGSKRVIATNVGGFAPGKPSVGTPREVLVVVSKVKDYIRARSEMNTSDAIMSLLSDRIREICDEAIDSARQEGRRTVLERDLKKRD